MKAVMIQLITTLRNCTPPENLAKLQRDHAPVASHCPACHTIWPCTIWAAAAAASRRPEGEPAS